MCWKNFKRLINLLILSLVLALGLLSCRGDLPSEKSTIGIDLSSLLKSIPVQNRTSAFTGPNSSDPTRDAISALVLGPLTFSSHGKAYDPQEPINDSIQEHLKNDLPNTSQYIKIISLPTSGDYLEIEVPSVSDGWQLFAVGLSKTRGSLEDLGTTEYQDAMQYYAIDTQVYKEVDEANAANITLTLMRACLADPTPKGCAIFNVQKKAVLSAKVEILDVQINGTSACSDFQKIIDTSGDETSVKNSLDECINDYSGTITSLKIETSHKNSPEASSACSSSTSVTDLRNNCGSQFYSNQY